ncbi:hypothetical protein DVS77_31860 [Mycolicibacterium moriokaense]|nr:hypothetical protein DVS77_31860 [Mycolicibacterium moriokaense]
MPLWGWFFLAALLLIAIAGVIVALSAARRRRTDRLRAQFGPEYDQTVAKTGGQNAAEKELKARQRQRRKLDIRPLSRDALEGYSHRWREVQTAFVDSPARALDDADRLLSEVMRERGYPVDDFDQRAADISVDYPAVVENYRAAHAIHHAGRDGQASTENQRQAFVHYRTLFDNLLDQHENGDTPTQSTQEAST